MKDTTYPYLTLKQTPDNSWRMRKYIKGMSITMFASFLAWTGMVVGSIFTLVALNSTPIPLFFVSITLFIFSVALWKNIVNKNMNRMKTLIKIGCYIMGGLELLLCAAGIITILVFINEHVTSRNDQFLVGYLMIPVCIFTIFIIFVSLMIHGVRKFMPRLVNTYIIFKIVIFVLYTLVLTVLMGNMDGVLIMIMVNTFLLGSLFYFYYNGFFVLHYDIMIGKGEGEEESLNLADNRPLVPARRI